MPRTRPGATTGGERDDNCPLHSYSRHHGCRESLFCPAKQGLSQISGRRVLRVIGHFVLSLSRRCFGASVGDKFCRNTSDQRWPLHRPFHPLLALFLFWLRQEASGLKRTPSHVDVRYGPKADFACPPPNSIYYSNRQENVLTREALCLDRSLGTFASAQCQIGIYAVKNKQPQQVGQFCAFKHQPADDEHSTSYSK